MNNYTNTRLPLRASETTDILYQQILGNIKRDGAGQFYTVEPEVNVVPCEHSEVFVKELK